MLRSARLVHVENSSSDSPPVYFARALRHSLYRVVVAVRVAVVLRPLLCLRVCLFSDDDRHPRRERVEEAVVEFRR